MRRTVIIIEHPTSNAQWSTPTGLLAKELGNLVAMIQQGKAGCTAYERHLSESGTVVTCFSDTIYVEDGMKYDSLIQIPYSQENASEMFLDKDGR